MPDPHLLSPRGFRAAGVHAGIKSSDTNDVGLLVCQTPATVAAAFTTNKVFAAPIAVGREHVADGTLRAVVLNSGNANACTGRQGMKDARQMCSFAAGQLGIGAADVLPSSTGIIGHMLPMEKVLAGIGRAATTLGDSAEHARAFGSAILTTDTRRKSAGVRVRIGGESVTVAGISKGAGMIGPRMAVAGRTSGRRPKQATMLAYLTTDARMSAASLRAAFAPVVDSSFNCVTIDDHTSTNDTAVLMASGLGPKISTPAEVQRFASAVAEVCQSLAYQIAADGEGATKVVIVSVRGAETDADARTLARSIANSPLVKCAMNGNDPNWGRIVSAAGLAGPAFDPQKATLKLQGTAVFRNGQPVDFDAEAVSRGLADKEVAVDLSCRLGDGQGTVWTCDLSKEYVSINADYHT